MAFHEREESRLIVAVECCSNYMAKRTTGKVTKAKRRAEAKEVAQDKGGGGENLVGIWMNEDRSGDVG